MGKALVKKKMIPSDFTRRHRNLHLFCIIISFGNSFIQTYKNLALD